MAITDDIGDVVRDRAYDAYGRVTGGSGATPSPIINSRRIRRPCARSKVAPALSRSVKGRTVASPSRVPA